MCEAFAAGKEITKQLLWSSEITNYKALKIAAIQQENKRTPSLLDEPEPDFSKVFEKTKPQKVTREKKSTYEQTLDLHQEGKTITEIAQLRQVSKQTIYNHFVQLIKSQKVELSEIMSAKRIGELQTYFEDYHENSLGPLKEKLGAKVTWDELKVYQAHAQVNSD